jgi:Tol biopolymer transport system component
VNVFVADFDSAAGVVRGQPMYLTERLAGWNAAPGYSPDGRFVGFKRRRPDTPFISDLVVRTLESGEERTYAAPDWLNPAFLGAPTTWLHDGSGLLVGAEPLTSPGSPRWLGRLDLKDGVFRKVLEVDATLGWMAALSPDDETVYMLHSPDARYLTVDGRNVSSSSYVGIDAVALASGRRRNVFTLSGGGTVNSPALSPDGRILAFFIYEDGKQQRTRLASVSVDGFSPRDVHVTSKSIANRPDQIQWSRDGRSLLFIEEGRVMRISSQGGTPQFTGLAMTRPDRTHPISLSQDGSRIAFSDGAPWSTDREVWAIDNVLAFIDSPRP